MLNRLELDVLGVKQKRRLNWSLLLGFDRRLVLRRNLLSIFLQLAQLSLLKALKVVVFGLYGHVCHVFRAVSNQKIRANSIRCAVSMWIQTEGVILSLSLEAFFISVDSFPLLCPDDLRQVVLLGHNLVV